MAVLIAAVNVSAAVLAFASAALCKRQAIASPQRSHAASRDLAPAPAIVDALSADATLSLPVGAGS
jgi:hypothetical protein